MTRLHHVQVSAPAGCEEAARAFWSGVLGLSEVEKPAELQARGGCWFRALDGDTVAAEVHVGVEADFRPARKAHPALVVDDLDAVAEALRAADLPVDLSQRDGLAGYERLHTTDPFGNRVELLAPRAG
ncbi:glyoxalase [Nocardioides mangrovicus]|uniref:Glyoxalase n=1 Tax=Nocardioides mangrovicus TaxID=2478913 RepID=A0A3L8P270_9ACTN|nr:VOC family protein [Nocardioides mangrovicus]RLV48498.1 glyoxalase [Nocardioides mangrovicus]